LLTSLVAAVFETTYVHRWVAALRLRWKISDLVIKRVLWFMTGTQEGCNQWVGGLPPERLGRAYVFLK
jgi:dimethylaniline monooxygenase (N-oxide forming)